MSNDQLRIDLQKKEIKVWRWIKQQLAEFDYSFTKLARHHGVKKQNIAIAKHKPYPKYEHLIADSIGLKPWDLWPWRYDDGHNPNRISSRYQGHKQFLLITQNNLKSNGKDNQKIKPLKPNPEAAG